MENFLPGAPLNISSIKELLEINSKNYPQKEAVISVDPHTGKFDSLSHQDLKDLVFQTASLLNNLDIKKGDKYAILMPNTAEVLLFELAGALIGATTVPLDIKRDTLLRKIFKLKETSSKALFVNSRESASELLEVKKELPNIKIIDWKDFAEFKKLLPNIDNHLQINDGLEGDYVILYTSGTTNMPKGVPLSIKACLLNAMGIATWQKMTDKERFNIVLPLHHINSTIFCLSALLKGGTLILNKVYSASNFWKVIEKFKCTNTSIVPTILHDLLAKKHEFFESNLNVSSMKRICIGSAPVLPEQTLKFYQTFKIRVTQGYGQTETALRVSGVPVDLSENSYIKMVKINSIGTRMANNDLAIEEGEICIAGPTLGDGYLNDPEATKHSFKQGWFHSGDLGYFKNLEVTLQNGEKIKDKFYFIIGRIKEIIIKGGINISPSAIEDALLKAFPEIAEVSVVGYQDLRMGEEIACVVVAKENVDQLKLESKILEGSQLEKTISKYELPKKVFFLDSLPKTSTGKIQRVEAKNWVAKLIIKQQHYSVRIIKPDEEEVLKQVAEINNQGFKDIPSSLGEFRERAKNATLLGVFDGTGNALGSLSCVQLDYKNLETMKTWNQASGNGTLKNNDPKGDALVCVAISVKRHSKQESDGKNISNTRLKKLAKENIENYVKSDKDFVLNFHRKPKGGLGGATVWKILEMGRKEDKESMGYNVLLNYPPISKKTKIIKDSHASPSIKLMEQAFLTAKEKGGKKVVAFSRPAGFRKYLLSAATLPQESGHGLIFGLTTSQ